MIGPDTLVLPSVDDVRRAAERIAPYIRRTPVLEAALDGRRLTLKLEHLQITGSFKLRGALNAMLAGPAAAAPLAAWLAGRVPGEHACLIVCGANAPWFPGD